MSNNAAGIFRYPWSGELTFLIFYIFSAHQRFITSGGCTQTLKGKWNKQVSKHVFFYFVFYRSFLLDAPVQEIQGIQEIQETQISAPASPDMHNSPSSSRSPSSRSIRRKSRCRSRSRSIQRKSRSRSRSPVRRRRRLLDGWYIPVPLTERATPMEIKKHESQCRRLLGNSQEYLRRLSTKRVLLDISANITKTITEAEDRLVTHARFILNLNRTDAALAVRHRPYLYGTLFFLSDCSIFFWHRAGTNLPRHPQKPWAAADIQSQWLCSRCQCGVLVMP